MCEGRRLAAGAAPGCPQRALSLCCRQYHRALAAVLLSRLARAQAGPANGPEAAVLSGLQAGVRTAGGAEDRPQFSQGQSLFRGPRTGAHRPRAAPACCGIHTWGAPWLSSLTLARDARVSALPHSSGTTVFHTIPFPLQTPALFFPMSYHT